MSFEKDLSKLRKLNNRCADCNSINPSWASVNIGVLICQRCCIFHRKMGVHISRVKSITLDYWNKKYINHLKQNGNEKINKIYEYKLDKQFKPNTATSEYDLYEFIKNKYEHKLYFSRSIEKKLRKKVEKKVEKKLRKKVEKKKIEQNVSITPMISIQKDSDDKILDLLDFDSLLISEETKPINDENIWETFDNLENFTDSVKFLNDDNNVDNKKSNDIEKITSLFKSSQKSLQQNQQPNFYRQNTYPVQQNQQPNFYRQNTYPVQQNQQPNFYRQNTYPVQQNQNQQPNTYLAHQNQNQQTNTYPVQQNQNQNQQPNFYRQNTYHK
jgi:hypothetical protein